MCVWACIHVVCTQHIANVAIIIVIMIMIISGDLADRRVDTTSFLLKIFMEYFNEFTPFINCHSGSIPLQVLSFEVLEFVDLVFRIFIIHFLVVLIKG